MSRNINTHIILRMKKVQVLQKTNNFSLTKVKDTKTGRKWYAIRVGHYAPYSNKKALAEFLGPHYRYVSSGLEWRFTNLPEARKNYLFILLKWS